MDRTRLTPFVTPLAALAVVAITYAAVTSAAWVFVVLPVVPAVLLASAGLWATFLTRAARPSGSAVLLGIGGMLAVAGAASAVGYAVLWGVQLDYQDSGRDVPAGLARWDDITFVGSAAVCAASIILAVAVLARARRSRPGIDSMSTYGEGPDTTLSVVRH